LGLQNQEHTISHALPSFPKQRPDVDSGMNIPLSRARAAATALSSQDIATLPLGDGKSGQGDAGVNLPGAVAIR